MQAFLSLYMVYRFLGFSAVLVAGTISLSPVAHASHTPRHVVYSTPSYVVLPWSDANTLVQHYGKLPGLRYASQEEFNLRTSPYNSVTHALHPYYRDRYFGPLYVGSRISRPEFYRYLSDLYYSGAFDAALSDQARSGGRVSCYNYSTMRIAQRTPEWMTECSK